MSMPGAVSRRQALKRGLQLVLGTVALFGAGRWLAGYASSTRRGSGNGSSPPLVRASGGGICTLAAEQEEGPFFVDEGLLRADVRQGQPGVPLALSIKLVNARTCMPLAGAAVDIWSASHTGKYTDETEEGTIGLKFFRGVQITDPQGMVHFKTIYPGWYSDRTCHIHLKVRTGGTVAGSTYRSSGSKEAHSGQLFFPEVLNEQLRTVYKQNLNSFINNSDDGVYADEDGVAAVLSLKGSMAAGYTTGITLGVKV